MTSDFDLMYRAANDTATSKADVCLLATILKAMGRSFHLDASVNELSEEAGLDQRTVTRALKKLTNGSYIVRDSGGPEQMNRYKRP